jgi:hypothetical protein
LGLNLTLYYNSDTIKKTDRIFLRQKLYKQNGQTIWIIVENKNIQALWQNNLLDHLDTVYSYTDTAILLHRNNICFFWGGTIIKIYWIYIEHYIVSVIQ